MFSNTTRCLLCPSLLLPTNDVGRPRSALAQTRRGEPVDKCWGRSQQVHSKHKQNEASHETSSCCTHFAS